MAGRVPKLTARTLDGIKTSLCENLFFGFFMNQEEEIYYQLLNDNTSDKGSILDQLQK